MKITNKYIFLIVIAGFISSIALTGCKDSLLNQKPRGQLTVKNFWQNKSDAIRATNATYQAMTGFQNLAFTYLALTDIASDDAVKGSTAGDASYMTKINNADYDPTNPAFIGVWNAEYKGIFRANQAIANIPGIDMNEQLKHRLVGENKFLRAYFYFALARAFGGVPLVKKPSKPGEYHQKRSPIDSVYAFIISDLKYAANVLPSLYQASDVGRATKGAANAYLAKVYLFMKNYKMAEKYAQNVITSGQYSLLPSYSRIFTQKGENSSGIIFEVQAKAVANGTGGTQYSQTQGVRGTPNLGWGFNMPSRNLVEAYEPGDPRMEATILFDYEELPDGSDAVRDNVNIRRYYKTRERYNQKAFVSESIPGGPGNSGVNVPRMRYSDVLLIAAEAAYRNGNTERSQKYVNMVRKRARGEQKATLGLIVEPVSSFLADTLAASSASTQQLKNTIENKPFIRFVQDGGPAAGTKLMSFDWKLYQKQNPLIVKHIDIIRSINGTPIKNLQDYRSQVEKVNPGQVVTLSIERVTQTNNGPNVTTHTQRFPVNIKAQQLLPDITATGKALLEAIWHEHRVELAMEQHRYFNLHRQGRAMEVLQALGINFTKKDKLYPIPQREIDFLGEEAQNPGY